MISLKKCFWILFSFYGSASTQTPNSEWSWIWNQSSENFLNQNIYIKKNICRQSAITKTTSECSNNQIIDEEKFCKQKIWLLLLDGIKINKIQPHYILIFMVWSLDFLQSISWSLPVTSVISVTPSYPGQSRHQCHSYWNYVRGNEGKKIHVTFLSCIRYVQNCKVTWTYLPLFPLL